MNRLVVCMHDNSWITRKSAFMWKENETSKRYCRWEEYQPSSFPRDGPTFEWFTDECIDVKPSSEREVFELDRMTKITTSIGIFTSPNSRMHLLPFLLHRYAHIPFASIGDQSLLCPVENLVIPIFQLNVFAPSSTNQTSPLLMLWFPRSLHRQILEFNRKICPILILRFVLCNELYCAVFTSWQT